MSDKVANVKVDAIYTLRNCGVALGADFHTLSTDQVDSLLVEADKHKYRKPKLANGSRGRYFHDLLQRRAKRDAINKKILHS